MSIELIEHQPIEEHAEDDAQRILKPLLHGEGVALVVTDSRIMKKRRLKGTKPVLLIAPLECYNPKLYEPYLVISLAGHGCEIVHVDDIKTTILNRVGLSMKSSKVLKGELDKLYGDRSHGEEEKREQETRD